MASPETETIWGTIGLAAAAIVAAWRGWVTIRRGDTKTEVVEGGYQDLIASLREQIDRMEARHIAQEQNCATQLAAQEARIQKLEATVSGLRDENEDLRRRLAAITKV